MPSFLVLSWALSFGFIPDGNLAIERPANAEVSRAVISYDESKSLTQTIELGLTAFDLVTVWTSIETYDRPKTLVQYAPFRSDYSIGARVSKPVGWAVLEAGVTHECIHPVLSCGDTGNRVYGGGTEVYVKVSGRIGK